MIRLSSSPTTSLSLATAALAALLLAAPSVARAADAAESSADKARQALAVLQSDAPPGEKAVACKRLAVFGGPEAVAALAPLLGDERLSSWARIPLEVLPGPAADDALRDAMGRLYGNLLVGVINSVGVRGDAKAVDPLIGRLKDANVEVGAAAAVALGRIGGASAVTALEGSLAAPQAGLRSAAAEGLIIRGERILAADQAAEAARLYDAVRKADVPKQRKLEAARGSILARGAEGLPLLLETLRSPDQAMHNMGLRVSRELSGRAVTEALAAELSRIAPERQGPLLLALTDRKDEAVWPAVLAAAKQGTKSLRLVALAAVERRGTGEGLPVLLDAAADADAEVSKAAKAAVGRLPGKDVDAALLTRWPQATGASRRVLAELSGQRRLAAAVPSLFKAAGESDAELRSASLKALGETVDAGQMSALADLLGKASSEDELGDVESALDTACSRLTDKAACAQPLVAKLGSSKPAAKVALLRVLGTAGSPNALAAVRGSLNDGDATVREAAFRALVEWPESSALPAILETVKTSTDDTRRTLALRGAVRLLGLGDQPAAQSVATYRELLGSVRRVDDRKLLLSGLGKVADSAALKLVEPLLAEAAVRKEAEAALLGIAGGLVGSAPAETKAVASRLKSESTDAGTRERAAQLLQSLDKVEDFLTAWQFAGAYTLGSGENGSVFAKEFPPEKSEANVTWRPLAAGSQPAKPWMMDLLATKIGEAGCAAYARTWVYSEKAQAARIEFGTDDRHKLWLNGERIAQADRGGAAVPGEFKTIVSLRQGWNALLLKVTQDSGPWEFCLRIRTPGGEKFDGLRVQATPPER